MRSDGAVTMNDKVVYRGEMFFREDEPFSIVRCAEAQKADRVFHSHDFVEICYVSAGTGFHVVGGEEYRVAKGDLFLINYDITHAFYRDRGDDELVTHNILFKPGFLDVSLLPFHDFTSLTMSYLFKNIWDDKLIREDLRLGVDEQREYDRLIAKMHQEYLERPDGYDAVIRACMIELIVKIMRGFSRKSMSDRVQHKKASVIEAALRHLDAFYYEPVSLCDLARKWFISKNYFAQLFKETTGMTVSQYTRQIRIEEACRLIRETDKKMTQIALEVGYADYKAFFLAFRKETGVSPNEYQKS